MSASEYIKQNSNT